MELDWHIEKWFPDLASVLCSWAVKIIKNKLKKTDLQFFIPSLNVRLEPVNASISWDQEQLF
jgi:hypothetical protein